MKDLLKSSPCTRAQLESDSFRRWCAELREPFWLGRKLWEWCFICQALFERGMLAPNRRGLGFAVGREPLAALFASYGCEIVATDLGEEDAKRAGWVSTNQHATNLDALNDRGICPKDVFRERVRFRTVDMNRVPRDLRDFDFAWSSCSVEHLGTLRRGMRFMQRVTQCLKPGGAAVHTTEFNVLSNTHTVDRNEVVVYRRRDFEEMARWFVRRGHRIELQFDLGDSAEDWQIDRPPYGRAPHLKLQIGEYVATSYGLIVVIGEPRPWWRR